MKIVYAQYLIPFKLTANFFTIALTILLTNVPFESAAEDNSMLKERFTVPGTMTASLPKLIRKLNR